jgi:hypothetical protein
VVNQSVEGMRPRIGAACDGLLERLTPPGPGDLMEGIAQEARSGVDDFTPVAVCPGVRLPPRT